MVCECSNKVALLEGLVWIKGKTSVQCSMLGCGSTFSEGY
jgi:hypothetical protein